MSERVKRVIDPDLPRHLVRRRDFEAILDTARELVKTLEVIERCDQLHLVKRMARKAVVDFYDEWEGQR